MGLNTLAMEELSESKIKILVKAILNEITPSYTQIYFEDFKDLNQGHLDYILDSTGLSIPTGNSTRIFNIPYLIDEIHRELKKPVNSNDTLIISENREVHLELILKLMDRISFFTCLGIPSPIREEVYNEVFTSTGISIFQPLHIDKVIMNYGTIINFSNEVPFGLEKIRNGALIIDFSSKKPFKILENSKKNVILIEDIRLKTCRYNDWIDEFTSPELFEALGETNGVCSHIYTRDNFYRMKDFVHNNIKKTGKI